MATDTASSRLSLPQVTLCAITSVNVGATLLALGECLAQIDFAACKLFVDQPIHCQNPAIEIVPIPRLCSSAAYSDFVLRGMAGQITTSHCLIVQWDGHVLDADLWRPEFMEYDFIGARWPQFDDGHDVGNGGFSLRSRKLMELCPELPSSAEHAEDLAICRANRTWLEQHGMRFAPAELADLFSTERAGNLDRSFGYHGAFNMPRALGAKRFGRILRQLDDRSTVWHDFWGIAAELVRQPGGFSIAARMAWDRLTQEPRR